MQLADRIFIIAKGVLFVRIIDRSLLLNHSPSEWFSLYKKERQVLLFDVQNSVHLQGLEPWAHWLRETNAQQSSISGITQIRRF